MKKLVIFDLDGTLLNSINDINTAINLALKDLSLPSVSVEDAKYLTGSGVKILAERTINFVLKDKYEEEKDLYLDKFMDLYQHYYTIHQKDETKPYDGIIDALKELKKLGIKIAVLSNKPHFDVIKIIDYYFKEIKFDYILGKIEKNRIKPDIDGIIMIEEDLNIKNNDDILYVGDTNVDIKTARNANIEVLACTWGFRSFDEIKDADYIAYQALDIVEVIKNGKKLKDGILLLNKQKDISSNAIINKVKWTLNRNGFKVDKIGHSGTLDPNATGLLVVLINQATKLSDYLLLDDKEYVATILLGKSYDTYDVCGKLIEEKTLNENDLDYVNANIDSVLKSFIGTSMQIPPIYSSLKMNGRKLYEMARNNETIDIEAKKRQINIYEISLLNKPYLQDDMILFDIKCHVSKGTYIRSLAFDVGQRLNMPACIKELQRTKSGCFDIKDSYNLKDIEIGNYHLINMLECIKNMEIINADSTMYNDIVNGRMIKINSNDEMIAIAYENELVAIYEHDKKDIFKAKRVWK